ncbi:unnamed protein product [Cylindrotheca closterium]|uniref:Glutaredoxin domain-containing protein n=1 Tax=Cylindrotheca closterium TaxID=2856 RepID=A0AAD2FT00_9STRA|nr:unnamed protein product [Cylindrotheca closterium]
MAPSNTMAGNIRELEPNQQEKRETRTEEQTAAKNEDKYHDIMEDGKMGVTRQSSEQRANETSDHDIEIGMEYDVSRQSSGRRPSNELPTRISLDDASNPKSERPDSVGATVRTTESAEESVIIDIDAYEGSTLGEKIEAIIASHSVVMFNRTWCLFSVDAIDFMVKQLNVPVHSVEIDVHPQGKEILKYVTQKTKHATTPFIFIRGEFLGGFSEVNALYAKGNLQKDYLKGLSQADQCETFISNSQYSMSTYFWFPDKVDATVVRITGSLTFFASVLAAVLVHFEEFFWAHYVAYVVAIDFFLRFLGGARISLFGRIAMILAFPFEPMPRMGKPKQFATCLGLLFSVLGSFAFLAPFPYNDYVGSAFMAGLAIATGLEGFLDFCIGCFIFRIGVKLGFFKGTS